MPEFDLLISAARGIQWQRTKGEMRAMVAAVGCTTESRAVTDKSVQQWEELEQRVEDFIRKVEDDGLHE